jgi:ABC-type antimicrobial peptide transport system permease subunit
MNGKLLVQPHFFQILLILGIVVVTTMILVYFTIRRCVNINPVEALSVTE